jgi:hypothetical protein
MTKKITTRSEYMQAMTEVGFPDTPTRSAERQRIHHEYYMQFSNQALVSLVLGTFDIETLMESYAEDKNFNTQHTPLDRWDRLFGCFTGLVAKSLIKETDEGMSLSTCVCTCKAIARSLVNNPPEIPESQCKEYVRKWVDDESVTHRLVVLCKLTSTSSSTDFSITSDLFVGGKLASCGMLDELISEHLPEVLPLTKWHGYGRRGDKWHPPYYLANAIYLAGNKDCHGLVKGEIRYGKAVAHAIGCVSAKYESQEQYRRPDGAIPLSMISPDYIGRIESVLLPRVARRGEGKDRDFEGARRVAIWPDATEADLTDPNLEQRLLDRLPDLFEEFKAAMENAGFKLQLCYN